MSALPPPRSPAPVPTAVPPWVAADEAAAGAGASPLWQVRLLGALEARCGKVVINHFPTRAAGALLARLALQPERAHPREELVELLWPGAAPEVGRNRLRQTLSTLKSALQAGGAGVVLQADRSSIRALPGALACDVRRFDSLARAGQAVAARDAYGGDLMPGFYEEWVLEERQRLAVLFERMDQRALQAGLQAATHAHGLGVLVAGAATPQPQPPTPPLPIPASAIPPSPQVTPAPSGLPHFWTKSVGAEMAASRLSVLVRAQRLVTVHGPGGSGKTRLAVDVARGLRDEPVPALHLLGDELQQLQRRRSAARFDRITFVPLVDCVDAAQTLDAICTALQLEAGGGQAHTRITAALAGSRTLLVLDNLEQLDAPACQAIAGLLAAVPGLHVMATSRLLLDLDGEQAFELDGLALPNAHDTLEAAALNPAVMLFVDRARAASADFHLDAHNLPAVAALVRLLGGMPLAIELAASRLRALTPGELLQHLSQGAGTPMLDLLARNAQRTTASSRHASMRHVVGWSWRQLRPEQADLMRGLTVFGAPALLAAVAAVAGLPAATAQTLLDTLCDACMVRHAPDAQGRTRYSLQQPVREFAAERWPAEQACQARQRLRRWLLHCVAQAQPGGAAAVAAAITPELAHAHAVLASAPADGAINDALDLALALRSYWDQDDLPRSAVQSLECSVAGLTDPARLSDTHELLAQASANAGQKEAADRHAQAAIAAARLADDNRRLALALTRWVATRYYAGQLQAEPLLQSLAEASVLAQRSGDATAQATVLRAQASVVANLLLDYDTAEKLAEQGQLQWERAGNAAMARMCLLSRATAWAWCGREEQALQVFAHCEAAALADNDWVGALTAARQAGRVGVRLRRWPPAVQAFGRALHVGWQRRYARGLANTLLNMPEALLMAGQADAAARLQGFALAHWARLFGPINRIERAEQRRLRRLLRLRLGGPALDAMHMKGEALDLPQAVELAQSAGAQVGAANLP